MSEIQENYVKQGEVFVSRVVSEIYRQSYVTLSRQLSSFGLSYLQMQCLIELYIREGQTQEELSETLMLDKAAVHRAVHDLLDQGYLTRSRHERDKRAFVLHLTPKALAIQAQLFAVVSEKEQKMTQGITEKELKACFKALQQMSINLKNEE